jgi:hypothetical protein
MKNQFKVGDIIKAIYFHNDNLYYLITYVSETTAHYKAIHLASNRETLLYFPTAHMEYKVSQ